MATYTIIHSDGLIAKDGVGFDNLDLSFLPSDVLAVQVYADGTADIEKGDRVKQMITANEDVSDKTTISWWSNVEATWTAANDAYLAEEARVLAMSEAAEASGD
jgi:hypothetical protein